jgi:UDP-2-acetamido-2,6-beta-L-arabino-hexul-4-ose reductase
MTILVTGSNGFIGKHLVEALRRRPDTEVIGYDLDAPAENLERGLREADVIYHLAGVNRPQKTEEFKTGNADFTESLCSSLSALGRRPLFVLSSSIQAALDNPYGVSKRYAEEALQRWAAATGGRAVIFRLKNVFGKWCRPNYNSVTATFCHNIAHDLPISISDPSRELDLVYIDDVIAAFLSVLDQAPCTSPLDVPRSMLDVQRSPQFPSAPSSSLPALGSPPLDVGCSMLNIGRSPEVLSAPFFREVNTSYRVTLGDLADKIRSFRASRQSLVLPSFADEFTRRLYATYLSYLDGPNFAYALEQRTDNRGTLAEFMKSAQFGQLFVSRTKPGITRGNHYHHTKTEKFLVVEGEAVIRFRFILGAEQGAGSGEPGGVKTNIEHSTSNAEHPRMSTEQGAGSGEPGGVKTNFEHSTLNTEHPGMSAEQGAGSKEPGTTSKEERAGSKEPAASAPPTVIEHRVSGREFKVVDIPPGYAHSIENVGTGELVTLFWASEIFDPTKLDTYPMVVIAEKANIQH